MIDIHDSSLGCMNASSGAVVNYKHPGLSEFHLEDIATGLSNDCRFGGQLKNFYSVAQHSVLVMSLAPAHLSLAALFHDSPEAYMRDIPKPLKNLLPQYVVIEALMQNAIFSRFGISLDLLAEIKEFDKHALEIENESLRQNKPEILKERMQHFNSWHIFWPPDVAKDIWLKQVTRRLKGGGSEL